MEILAIGVALGPTPSKLYLEIAAGDFYRCINVTQGSIDYQHLGSNKDSEYHRVSGVLSRRDQSAKKH